MIVEVVAAWLCDWEGLGPVRGGRTDHVIATPDDSLCVEASRALRRRWKGNNRGSFGNV